MIIILIIIIVIIMMIIIIIIMMIIILIIIIIIIIIIVIIIIIHSVLEGPLRAKKNPCFFEILKELIKTNILRYVSTFSQGEFFCNSHICKVLFCWHFSPFYIETYFKHFGKIPVYRCKNYFNILCFSWGYNYNVFSLFLTSNTDL